MVARACGALLYTFVSVVLISAQVAPQPTVLRVDTVPVGLNPQGLDIADLPDGKVYAAVANSGDNSVSVLELLRDPATDAKTVRLVATVQPVPGPYAVAFCRASAKLLATSPSDNSITVMQVTRGNVWTSATLKVGPLPYAVACFDGGNGPQAVVSMAGDNTLWVIDVNFSAVTTIIPNVPASRAWHGVATFTSSQNHTVAAVAGTDANVVTFADLNSSSVLARVPFRKPTAVNSALCGTCVYAASAADNTISFISPTTFEATVEVRNVPAPRDFTFTGLGTFATTNNAVVRVLQDGSNRTFTIPNVPGASALSSFPSSGNFAPSTALVLVSSPDSNSLFLLQAPLRLPNEFGVANGASFSSLTVAPGGLASAFAPTGLRQNVFAAQVPLPTTLGGIAVRIGGSLQFTASGWLYSSVGSVLAPLLFAGATQVNFQVPPGTASGDAVPIQLTKPDGTTLLSTMRVVASSPGIFTVLMNGQGQAAALNQDNSQNGDPQRILGARPSARGSVIQIFATGAGATNPPLAPGEAAPASGSPLVLTQVQPTVTIGGKTARVVFSGLAPGFVGLWQINAEIPADVTPGVAVPLVITAAGAPSNTVSIAVQ